METTLDFTQEQAAKQYQEYVNSGQTMTWENVGIYTRKRLSVTDRYGNNPMKGNIASNPFWYYSTYQNAVFHEAL